MALKKLRKEEVLYASNYASKCPTNFFVIVFTGDNVSLYESHIDFAIQSI